MRRGAWAIVAGLLALCLAPHPASAGHAHCGTPECMPVSAFPNVARVSGPVAVESLWARVAVVEAVAHTQVAMTVHNPGKAPAAADLRVPMPTGAILMAFNLTLRGETLEGVVVDTGRPLDESAQRPPGLRFSQASPRILAFNGTLAAGERWTLKAAYAELVPLHNQARVYRLPLAGLAVGRLDLGFEAHSRHGIEGPAFPALEVEWTQPNRLDLVADARLGRSDALQDFVAVWSEGPGDWLASMLCAAPPSGKWTEGLFLLQARADKALPRDVAFVIDHSGSMGDEKMEAARMALIQALAGLNATDRYEVVTFDNEVASYHGTLVDANATRVRDDQGKVATLRSRGGTDIDGGLQAGLEALAQGDGDRVVEVVLLTDGMPSSGVQDPARIIQRFLDGNTRGASLHALAIGLDAENTFLRELAERTGGDLEVIRLRDGELDARVASALERLEAPFAKDVQVSTRGFRHSESLEGPFPRLREDTTLAIAFGDDWPGPVVRWTVRATMADGRVEHEFAFTAEECQVFAAAGPLGARRHLDRLEAAAREDRTNLTLQAEIRTHALEHRLASQPTRWAILDGAGRLAGWAESTTEGSAAEGGPPSGTETPHATKTSASAAVPAAAFTLMVLAWHAGRRPIK